MPIPNNHWILLDDTADTFSIKQNKWAQFLQG